MDYGLLTVSWYCNGPSMCPVDICVLLYAECQKCNDCILHKVIQMVLCNVEGPRLTTM